MCLMLPNISSSLSKPWSEPSRLLSILLTANVPQSFITIRYTVPNPPDPTTSSSSRDSNFSMISNDVYGRSPWKVISLAPATITCEPLQRRQRQKKNYFFCADRRVLFQNTIILPTWFWVELILNFYVSSSSSFLLW